ncbi:MAG: putative sensor histidine kinase pdtaS [Candidatus Parcubacteria bacterium]|jgi:hypothetical protein
MILNTYQKYCFGFFALLIIFWLGLFFTGTKDGLVASLYVFLYGLIPLVGGVLAIRGYRTWGGLSTILGKAIFFIGLGLFFWGIGETIWAYYNFFLDVEIPYPSLADVFFAPSVFFYTLGTIFLSMTTGVRFGLRNMGGKIFSIVAPFFVFLITYYILIIIGHQGELFSDTSSFIKTVLDIAYPIGDAVALSVAVVVAGLSFRYLGGVYKYDVISILLGLTVMFTADSYLSYTSTIGTAYSGDFGDLLFTVAVFLLTFGLLGFNKIKKTEVIVG